MPTSETSYLKILYNTVYYKWIILLTYFENIPSVESYSGTIATNSIVVLSMNFQEN